MDLNLNCNDLGPEGFRAFASTLVANSTLTELSLSNNNPGIEGATAISQAITKSLTL